ncbi:MAG: LysE family translocator [Bacteroidales bacterium]|nr:LysE family translocator [Bacteroidales bacterium]
MTISFLLSGIVFGFTAGISPGPLLTLVISESIRHNKKEGVKVALAPLITDLPIIVLAFFVLSRLSRFDIVLSIISFFGGIFVTYLGYECLKTKGIIVDMQRFKPASLKKGIIANILNPHPYLFWVTVGVPTAIKAYQVSLNTAILFFLAFYTFLLGSKVGIAVIAERTRSLISNQIYIWIMRILGLSLILFATLFFLNGIRTIKDILY